MQPLDKQDYTELIFLTSKAWSEELIEQGIPKRPTLRMISLKQLEGKLIEAKQEAKP